MDTAGLKGNTWFVANKDTKMINVQGESHIDLRGIRLSQIKHMPKDKCFNYVWATRSKQMVIIIVVAKRCHNIYLQKPTGQRPELLVHVHQISIHVLYNIDTEISCRHSGQADWKSVER